MRRKVPWQAYAYDYARLVRHVVTTRVPEIVGAVIAVVLLFLFACSATTPAPLSNRGSTAPERVRPPSVRHCAEFRFVTIDVGRCWWTP